MNTNQFSTSAGIIVSVLASRPPKLVPGLSSSIEPVQVIHIHGFFVFSTVTASAMNTLISTHTLMTMYCNYSFLITQYLTLLRH